MHFSSGGRARMRYMLEQDALLLLRVVGRPEPPALSGSTLPVPVGQYR